MFVCSSPFPSRSLLPFPTSPFKHFLIEVVVTSARASVHQGPPPLPQSADQCSKTSARDYGVLLGRSLYCAMLPLSLIFLSLGRPAGSPFLLCLLAYLLHCLPRCLPASVSACSSVYPLFSRRTCLPALAFKSSSSPSQRNE